ncbi:MAG: hypothetical protein MUQ40_01270, partial [Schleiferiaceae bacterium]|nr:hypothetical protein [Schleiferiaceae bacterium]
MKRYILLITTLILASSCAMTQDELNAGYDEGIYNWDSYPGDWDNADPQVAYDKGYEDGYGDAEVDFSGQQDSYTTTYRKWYRPRSIHYSTFYYGYNSPWSQNIWSPWGYSRGFNHQNSYMSWPYYPYNNCHSNYGYHFGYGYNYGNNFGYNGCNNYGYNGYNNYGYNGYNNYGYNGYNN